MNSILYQKNFPKDIKKLKISELKILTAEIRDLMIEKFKEVNGHVGSNLGAIEITTALHYVFNLSNSDENKIKDQIVYDVSHMSYTHKILTGRLNGFENFGSEKGFTGYTDPNESDDDLFFVGHTGVSIGLGNGLVKARDLNNLKYNVISFIGDGALSEGSSFEALNYASTQNTNHIIIVNDNQMSINENVGGVYQSLCDLRNSNGTSENNFFKNLGFKYIYEADGHDVEKLVEKLQSIKDINQPIIFHINTIKGFGFEPAMKNKARWHYGRSSLTWVAQYNRDEVKNIINFPIAASDYLDKRLNDDPKSVIIEPATPFLLQYLRYKYPDRFIDTGICEQTAVDLAAGLAKNGIKPFVVLDPGFSQRAYDQIHQEVCMQNAPVTFIIAGGAIDYGDKSHISISDIAMFNNFPNMHYLAPTSYFELNQMLDWCSKQNFPTAIRLGGKFFNEPDRVTPEIELGKSEIIQKGESNVIIAVGRFVKLALEVNELFVKNNLLKPTIINPRFVTSVDRELLKRLAQTHDKFITIEDGVVENGFGIKVSHLFSADKDVKVINFGADKEFLHYDTLTNLYQKYNLNPEQIFEIIRKA